MSMHSSLAALVLIVTALAIAVAMVLLAIVLGPRRPTAHQVRLWAFGIDPQHAGIRRVELPLYPMALLSLIFAAALVLLFPWAVLFKEYLSSSPVMAYYSLLAIGVFVGVLASGLIYAWKKGVFEC